VLWASVGGFGFCVDSTDVLNLNRNLFRFCWHIVSQEKGGDK
jgi:hypothetical protein